MKKFLALALIIIYSSTILTGCFSDERLSYISNSNLKFGTVVSLKIYGYTDESIFQEIWDLMDDMEAQYSPTIASSAVAKFNASRSTEPFKMPTDVVKMAAISQEYSRETDGLFDITTYPLTKLWNITSDTPKVPSSIDIIKAQLLVDYRSLEVNTADNTLTKRLPELEIDLGAIAKGYAADQIATHLKEKGIQRAIVNLGGNIFALGSKDDKHPWNIGIQDPLNETGNAFALIAAKNKSIVTSGTYERFFEVDGKRYHHILNPKTGSPVDNELIAITIISDQSVIGDALSTSIFALGLEKGMAYIKNHKELSAIFVTKDKKVYLVGDVQKSFELKDTTYTLQK